MSRFLFAARKGGAMPVDRAVCAEITAAAFIFFCIIVAYWMMVPVMF